MLDRTATPPVKDTVDLNLSLKPYEKYTLNNGVPVYAVNAGAENVLVLELNFKAGNNFDSQNLEAYAANHLLKNGTTQRSAFGINEHFDYYGAYLSRSCQNETANITLHCLTKHLPKLLYVIRELITESVYPEQELDIFVTNHKQQLSVNLLKCEFVANRLNDVYLYGDSHPYARFSSHADYDALNIEQLKTFYHKYYVNGSCTIFTAGQLPEDFFALLNENFGDLSIGNKIVALEFTPQPATQKKFRINNDPEGVQGAIRLSRSFPNRHHPDFKNALILNTLFGGFFGSRLMNNIREEKGYTYGISSYLQNHIQQSAWVISTEAGKSVCEDTIKEVYKEMQLLREEPVDAEELLLVKNYLMGAYLGDIDGPFQIIARWKNLILNNLDESYFYDSMQAIKNITEADIQALANRYLLPEDFYELVVV